MLELLAGDERLLADDEFQSLTLLKMLEIWNKWRAFRNSKKKEEPPDGKGKSKKARAYDDEEENMKKDGDKNAQMQKDDDKDQDKKDSQDGDLDRNEGDEGTKDNEKAKEESREMDESEIGSVHSDKNKNYTDDEDAMVEKFLEKFLINSDKSAFLDSIDIVLMLKAMPNKIVTSKSLLDARNFNFSTFQVSILAFQNDD